MTQPHRIVALAAPGPRQLDELAEVLIDCLDGGASVSAPWASVSIASTPAASRSATPWLRRSAAAQSRRIGASARLGSRGRASTTVIASPFLRAVAATLAA